MADYGHELMFGTFLTPNADQADRVIALAELTEQVGLDLVTVQDHPYQARFLDAWTLLSVIAARTSRVRVSPNVANLPLRPPAVLASSVASLDILTGGRVELGLGAGAFWEAITAYGGPKLAVAERVDALEEGIRIMRAIWAADGPAVRIGGKHHRVWGAHPGPAPAHDVGIWLGAYKSRMLRLTGRLADGWLPSSSYAAPETLPAMNKAIDEAAVKAGSATRRRTTPVQHQRLIRARRHRLPARAGAGLGRTAGRTDPQPGDERLHPRQRRPGRHPPLRRRGRARRTGARAGRTGTRHDRR